MVKRLSLEALVLMIVAETFSSTHYVSSDGRSFPSGIISCSGHESISKALPHLTAGDTLLILPGLYRIRADEDSGNNHKEKHGLYAVAFDLSMSGYKGNPIVIKGVLDENGNRPVIDLSEFVVRDEANPEGCRITGFLISGSYLHISDLECTGIQVTRTDHTQSENFRIDGGCYNSLENLSIHDGMGIGVYIKGNSHHNLVVNCDAYNNYDPVSDVSKQTGEGSGGNNDGFGCHVAGGMEGNTFIGCRAWRNSDDGFDLINCYSPVEFSYCVALENGYDTDGKRRADGNGLKSGGFGMRPKDIPLHNGEAPRHTVANCVAVANKASGVYSNHHLGGIDFVRNTSFLNGRSNFSMVNRKGPEKENNIDVNGYGHQLVSNISLSVGEIHTQWMKSEPTEGEIACREIDKDVCYDALYSPRLSDGRYSDALIEYVERLKTDGKGADFSGIQSAVEEARKVTGADAE